MEKINFDYCRVLDEKFEPPNSNRNHFVVSKESLILPQGHTFNENIKKLALYSLIIFFIIIHI